MQIDDDDKEVRRSAGELSSGEWAPFLLSQIPWCERVIPQNVET